MEKDSKKIIVPWDFSEKAEFALEHAERIARTLDKNIELLHIVDKENKMQSRESELEKVTQEAFKKYGLFGFNGVIEINKK